MDGWIYLRQLGTLEHLAVLITTINLGLVKELCELGAETLELTEFRLKFWKETFSEWKQRAVEWERWPVFPLLSSSLDLGEVGMMRK